MRDHGQSFGVLHLHALHIGHVFNQVDAIGELPHGAFHLGVALVANHQEFVAFFVQLGHFHMHLGDQRAGGIKHLKAAHGGLLAHRLAHAVCTEDQGGTGRHFSQVFNEDGALGPQVFHHIGVVHDFMAHIDGCTVEGECALNDFDGTIHPGAKAPRLREHHFLQPLRHHSTPIT